MKKVRYIYWQDGDFWLGYLEAYPDTMTQGETREDLEAHLRDLHQDLSSGAIPGARPAARSIGELQIA